MSELNEESGTTETETLEEALSKNFAALSEESVSTEAPPPEETGNVTADESTDELVAETEQESPSDALEPLEKWSESVQDQFRTLEPALQQFLLDREKDVESHLTKESQSLADIRKRYERMDEVFKPYDEYAKQRGVDLTPHVAQALQAYFAYQQDPLSTIRSLIQSAGLEQDQVFEDESLIDPSIRALRQQVSELKQQLQQTQSEPTQDQSEAERTLQAFQEAKDEQGNPKYPHFDQLREMMAPLVNQGKSLEDAYSESLWSLPEFRQAQLEKERKEALKEAESKRAAKVSKAKKAAETLPASDVDTGSGLPKFTGRWEDALKQTLENSQ